jgi:hypothetical protein
MPAPRSRTGRLLTVVLAATVGGVLTYIVAWQLVSDPVLPVRILPYPHHVPKTPDGISLRFAMVQDVLHERFARHGPAYYAERNRLATAEMATLPPGDRRDALIDDLAAGLDKLGNDDEAVRLLREKMVAQIGRGVTSRGLYTTYANLGTFLIHGNVHAAQAGDAAAKDRLREGLEFIRKAIEVNPDSHFGREQWQAVAVEFILAATDNQNLRREFDFIGNRLDADIDPRTRRAFGLPSWLHGGAYIYDFRLKSGDTISRDEVVAQYIQPAGAEAGWPVQQTSSHPKPVPFDEPVLGIIGMWREGGGANPHFALCLGETMLRVGQRYLAWSAFERASRLADQFWPDQDQQQFLRDHCRKRQEMIERQLPAEEIAELRPRFDAELAYGERYQREYQQYEGDQIDKGQSIEDEYFHQAFYAGREPIASPVGPEDELLVTNAHAAMMRAILPGPRAGYTVLGAGLMALWVAIGMRRR